MSALRTLFVAEPEYLFSDVVRQVCVPLAFIVTVAANVASSLGAINGTTNADVSNKYQTYFTPDGWAFSIWGIIYLWNAFYVLYHSLPVLRSDPRERVLGWLFVLVCLLNAAWSIVFAYEAIVASAVLITAFLVTLLVACSVLWHKLPRSADMDDSVACRVIAGVNFSLYAGWLSVATIANWALLGTWAGWDGSPWTAQGWSVLMQSIAAALALLVALTQSDGVYAIPICVGLSAIASKNKGWGDAVASASSDSGAFVPDKTVFEAGVITACVAAASIVIGEALRLWRYLKSDPRPPLLPGEYTGYRAVQGWVSN